MDKLLWLGVLVCLSTGCTRMQATVHDRSNGVAVVHAEAVRIAHGTTTVLDTADSDGQLAWSIDDDVTSVLGIRAQGYVLWSRTFGELQHGPRTLVIELEPLWLSDFVRTGKKPSDVIEAKPCPCLKKK